MGRWRRWWWWRRRRSIRRSIRRRRRSSRRRRRRRRRIRMTGNETLSCSAQALSSHHWVHASARLALSVTVYLPVNGVSDCFCQVY